MSDQRMIDVIEDFFNIDGPHDRDRVIDAARCASALIRYLNHATQPGPRAERTLEWANTVHEVAGSLASVAHRQEQLLDQLALALDDMAADDPTLYDDRRDDKHPAPYTARKAAENLRAAAAESAHLGTVLDDARSFSVYLGND